MNIFFICVMVLVMALLNIQWLFAIVNVWFPSFPVWSEDAWLQEYAGKTADKSSNEAPQAETDKSVASICILMMKLAIHFSDGDDSSASTPILILEMIHVY